MLSSEDNAYIYKKSYLQNRNRTYMKSYLQKTALKKIILPSEDSTCKKCHLQ